MREDRADNLLRVAHFAQNLCAFRRMPLIGGVLVIGPALVVELVPQRGEAPNFFIGAGFARISAHTHLDREHMFTQALRSGVLAQQLPGVLASRHAALPKWSG